MTWISHIDFIKAFVSFSFAYYNEDWKHNIAEVKGDTGQTYTTFAFTTTRDQPVYILQDFYNRRMYPGDSCKSGNTEGRIKLFKGDVLVDFRSTYDAAGLR